jgi:AraC-like DNA-binding protein
VPGPGRLAVPDPSITHRGMPTADGPVAVPQDPWRARRLAALRRLLTGPGSLLERQSARGLAGRRGAARRSARGPSQDGRAHRAGTAALRRALPQLADAPAADVSPADLAAAAGLSRYRLTKALLEQPGTPPRAFQAARRANHARRLLEAGASAADARPGQVPRDLPPGRGRAVSYKNPGRPARNVPPVSRKDNRAPAVHGHAFRGARWGLTQHLWPGSPEEMTRAAAQVFG